MKIPAMLRRLNAAVDGWLASPARNAAGRAGLFRIVFSVFYLWHLSAHHAMHLAGLPGPYKRVLFVSWLPGPALSPLFLQLLEGSLVAAIVVLMIGYRVRLATAAVLVLGCIYEGLFFRLSLEHATVLLVAYIPLFMLVGGGWGATYSLDAVVARRARQPVVDPRDGSGRFMVPARAVLVVMSALFLSSAVFKVGFGATWLNSPGLFANIMLDKNVKAAIRGLPMNPLAPMMAQTPEIADVLAYVVVLFEGTFFLVLFSRQLFAVYVPLALCFHAMNALWLVVTFTPILVAYGLFVDWQRMRERLPFGRVAALDTVDARSLVAGTLTLAVATAAFWNWGPGLRAAFNMGGVLDWRTIWYPILVLAVVRLVVVATSLVGAVVRRPRRSGAEGAAVAAEPRRGK